MGLGEIDAEWCDRDRRISMVRSGSQELCDERKAGGHGRAASTVHAGGCRSVEDDTDSDSEIVQSSFVGTSKRRRAGNPERAEIRKVESHRVVIDLNHAKIAR